MPARHGVTLIELLVVLIIVGLVAAFTLPNFVAPREQARALNARNNLMAIYSAQQNLINNNNTTAYCISPACDSLSNINTSLSLSIQDDGKYIYACTQPSATVYSCTATRNITGSPITLTVNLTEPIQLNFSNPNPNPSCAATAGHKSWCNY